MSTPNKSNPKTGSGPSATIAIVGGGITGLFCAYVLASNGHPVELFESSDQFGGRIRSFLLSRELMEACEKYERSGQPKPIEHNAVIETLRLVKDKGEFENLEFCAEFGPMRIELDVQVLLKFLLKHLGIGEHPNPEAKSALEAAHREPFPSFSSPTSEADPLYQLRPDEEGKNPLELMKLALCRAVVHTTIDESEVLEEDKPKYEGSVSPESKGYKEKRGELIEKLRDAAAVGESIGPIFDAWAQTLREDDYWVIARYGRIEIDAGDEPVYIPLYTMGFWNLMSIYLSHNALTKVRDLGTFYHLLPENPNAAHWFTWQLRQLSISSQLEGINGGMQAITKNLLREMKYAATSPNGGKCSIGGIEVPMFLRAQVASITWGRSGGLCLNLQDSPHNVARREYSRVILALPKAPAHELVMASPDLKKAHNDRGADELSLPQMLDSSFGFPMVKAFFVVRDRWWEEAKRANWFATRFPTREVHYWKSPDPKSRRGMVMLYTDRPASSFWANYVPAGRQNDVEELCPDDKHPERNETREKIRARLKQRLVQYMNENHVPDITAADIIWCGIMDWGRLPYGAGNHAWRPERRFWETMADLAEIKVEPGAGRPARHVHVCGEAFTDYTGFIEGSLRSATYTLTKILKKDEKDSTAAVLKRILGVLKVDPDLLNNVLIQPGSKAVPQPPHGPAERRVHDYLEDLASWVVNLDKCRERPSGGQPPGGAAPTEPVAPPLAKATQASKRF